MCRKEIWHDCLVHTTVLGSLELLLINVAVGIADGGRHESRTLWEDFDEGDHLWAHQAEHVLVAISKQTSGALTEEASFVQGLRAKQKLLECENLAASLQVDLNLRVFDSL